MCANYSIYEGFSNAAFNKKYKNYDFATVLIEKEKEEFLDEEFIDYFDYDYMHDLM